MIWFKVGRRILVVLVVVLLSLRSLLQFTSVQLTFVANRSNTLWNGTFFTTIDLLSSIAFNETDLNWTKSSLDDSTNSIIPLTFQERYQLTSQETQNTALVIDVMSIGSKSRPIYYQTQASTWASHGTVRHFWFVTEDDDQEWANCSVTMNVSEISDYVGICRQKHASGFLQQYRFFPKRWILHKSNPVGWLCAQVRVGSALAKFGRQYLSTSSELLPDFALLVDDDTMFQMNLLKDILQPLNTSHPTVWAGCLNVLPLGRNVVDRFSPFGGAGTVWSRGALERLIQPIHCLDNSSNASDDDEMLRLFVHRVCHRIQENLILEQSLFREGMRLFEFIERVYYRYPNCFHSDWLLGHFIHYYFLSEANYKEPPWWDLAGDGQLLPLHVPDSVGVFNGSIPTGSLCTTTGTQRQTQASCHKESLLCHYVDPDRMQRVTNEWMEKP